MNKIIYCAVVIYICLNNFDASLLFCSVEVARQQENYFKDCLHQNDRGFIAFERAVKLKNISEINALFAVGYDPNFDANTIEKLINNDTQNLNLQNLLLQAVQKCPHVSIMELIIAAGADIHAQYSGVEPFVEAGDTILHHAAYWGNFEKVERLLQLGAKVNAKNQKNVTPLYTAIVGRNLNQNLIKLLSDFGADQTIKVNRSYNSSYYALVGVAANKETDVAVLNYLFNQGANVNVKDFNDGKTALHFAAESGNLKTVQWLGAHGADINARTTYCKRNPLHFAARSGDIDKVQYLIDHGANVNARDLCNYTPLHWAAISPNFNLDVIKLLLRRGADKNMKTLEGELALDQALCYADWYGKIDIDGIKYLIINGANINAIYPASDINMINLLKQYCMPGRTLLHQAALSGDLNKVKCLIAYRAMIDPIDQFGLTPLSIAQFYKHEDIVKFLKNSEKKID